MDKIYHAKVAPYHWALMAFYTFCIISLLRLQSGLLILFPMIYLVVIIEKLIHSTYTITDDGKLILYRGRFLKKKVLELNEVRTAERCTTMRIGRFYFTKYVLIQCNSGKYYVAEPIKEEEFVEALVKANPEINQVN